MKKIFVFLPLFVLLLFFVKSPISVNAEEIKTDSIFKSITQTTRITATEAGEKIEQENETKTGTSGARRLARKDRLNDLKVKACEARQKAITKRSEQIVKRAAKQEEIFTKITQRVEEFYAAKIVPSGKVVSNYSTLVADIATKEAAIAPLLVKAQTDAANFSCDKDHPANQVLTFNQDMKDVIKALESFRKSVRNLIVAVKGVAGTEGSATSSATPASAAQ